MKLFDSELHIMNILWTDGDTTAKRIAEISKNEVGWSKTTTYTVVKRCIEKGAIERIEPNFICHALVSRAEAQAHETEELIDKMYDGSAEWLIASLLERKRISNEELEKLKRYIERIE